ncbi:MAG: ABC transporter permease, partial [Acidobacteriaceae bacterium]|nr:ABC transporter permease [Acidobacteriaceae bacterium]
YELLRDHNHVFSTLFGFAHTGRLNVIVHGLALLENGEYVSGRYFAGLGVRPAIGRLVSQTDDQPSAASVVAISYALWQGQFGGSPNAVGTSILINGKPFVVVGVTPPEFFGIRPGRVPDIYIPVCDLPLVSQDRYRDTNAYFTDDHTYWIEMMGRLKSGVSFSAAQSELSSLFFHWVSQTARNDHDRATLPTLWLEEGGSGVDSLRRTYSKPLFVLMAMVALILTIACANTANLLLARAVSRRREIAVRLSLGAGRLRVIQQLLTESALLAIGGAFGGVFIAAAGIRLLTLLLGNGETDFTLHAQLDWRVLSFALVIALSTGLLFGIAPAIQATRVDVAPALKEIRLSEPRGRRRRFGLPFGLRHILIVSQIAISMLLVAGAGLFVRTLANLNAVELGFNRDNVLLFSLDGALAGYKDQSLADLYSDLQARFRLIPGVRNVTLADMPLVANWTSSTDARIPGSKKEESTSVLTVGPGFFETMQIPLLAGRAISELDRIDAPAVAVVNEIFTKRYFPGRYPIGRHFRIGGDKNGIDVRIVGVAKTARYNSLKGAIPPVTYLSYLQSAKKGQLQQMFFELRTVGDPLALENTVREIVHRVSPRVPVADVGTQAQRINETISQERTFAALCTSFGVLALVMACVGLYATTAYAVIRRTNEIGIRMALGAMKRRILWMVVKEVLVLGIVGLVIGFGGFWEIATYLKSFLWGLAPHDAAAFATAGLILVACTVMAGWAPAWRASRIDPMTALRHE